MSLHNLVDQEEKRKLSAQVFEEARACFSDKQTSYARGPTVFGLS